MTHKYLHTHTALSIAVACGNITCARVLIEAGATVTETPQSGKLALLHIAKTRGKHSLGVFTPVHLLYMLGI